MRQEEIGRSKTTRGSSKIEEKVMPKAKLYQRGIAQVIDGMDNPLLASALSLVTSDLASF